MDGIGANCNSLRNECRESSVGGTGYDENHEREEASGDAGWKEVLRSGTALEGDAEVEYVI